MNYHCEKRLTILIFYLIFLFLVPSCSQEGNSITREFHQSQPVTVKFSYEDKLGNPGDVYRFMGAATAAETRLVSNGEIISECSLVDLDYIQHGENSNILGKYKEQFFKAGESIASFDVFRNLSRCRVDSVIINSKFVSHYIWQEWDDPLPIIKTFDLTTRLLISETRNIKILGDGTFSVEEINYDDGTVTYDAIVVRDAGTGLIHGERIIRGSLNYDYHHYELHIGRWSCAN